MGGEFEITFIRCEKLRRAIILFVWALRTKPEPAEGMKDRFYLYAKIFLIKCLKIKWTVVRSSEFPITGDF